METKINTTTSHNISIEDKANILVDGFNAGKLFLHQLKSYTYKSPINSPLPKYNYPIFIDQTLNK